MNSTHYFTFYDSRYNVVNVVGVRVIMVLNATFNNISVTSSRSVLLVEETAVPGINHRLVASH
jgi:hypothetical protein